MPKVLRTKIRHALRAKSAAKVLLSAFPSREPPTSSHSIVFSQLDGGEVHTASVSSWRVPLPWGGYKLRGTQDKSLGSLGKRAPVHGTGISTERAPACSFAHSCTRSAVLVPLMADTNPFSRKRAHADPRAWHVPASTPRTSSSVAPWSQPLPTADPPTTTGLSLGRRLLPPAPAAGMSSNVPPAADRTHVVRLAADDIEDISDDDDSLHWDRQ